MFELFICGGLGILSLWLVMLTLSSVSHTSQHLVLLDLREELREGVTRYCHFTGRGTYTRGFKDLETDIKRLESHLTALQAHLNLKVEDVPATPPTLAVRKVAK